MWIWSWIYGYWKEYPDDSSLVCRAQAESLVLQGLHPSASVAIGPRTCEQLRTSKTNQKYAAKASKSWTLDVNIIILGCLLQHDCSKAPSEICGSQAGEELNLSALSGGHNPASKNLCF
jgi:hypothetical protein